MSKMMPKSLTLLTPGGRASLKKASPTSRASAFGSAGTSSASVVEEAAAVAEAQAGRSRSFITLHIVGWGAGGAGSPERGTGPAGSGTAVLGCVWFLGWVGVGSILGLCAP